MTEGCSSQFTGAVQRRHAQRHKMFEPIALNQSGVETRAHVLDLSSSGALVHCEAPPIEGSYVVIHALGLEASAKVRWARGKRFGIEFSQPLTPAIMEMLIRPR